MGIEEAMRRDPHHDALFFEAPMAIVLLAPDGSVREANPQAARLLDMDPAKIEQLGLQALHANEQDRRAAEQALAEMRAGERQLFELEGSALSGDGEPIWTLWRYAAARDDSGALVRVVVMGLDRSERRRAEAALAASERFLEQVVDHLPAMVFVKEAERLSFVRFNRAGEELLGFRREDLVGKNDYDFFPREQAAFFTAKDRKVLESGELLDIPEEPIQTAHGERWLHTRKIPLQDHDGFPEYLLGISTDITDARRARIELQESNRDLERFAWAAAHDLRAPLRTIRSYGDLLDRKAELADEHRRYLDHIRDSSSRLMQLLDDLLRYAQVGTGRRPFEAVSLGQLVDEVLAALAARIDELGATVHVAELPELQGDPAQLRLMLQNLVDNALKFHESGRSPTVWINSVEEGAYVVLGVRDAGIGIESDQLEGIFDVFKRLHGREHFEGTGIGLAICQRVAEIHGGSIQVESTPGVGTIFRVRLARQASG